MKNIKIILLIIGVALISGCTKHSLLTPKEGIPLQSRSVAYLKVRIWDPDDKSSSWSNTAHFSLGLLEKDEMNIQVSVPVGSMANLILPKGISTCLIDEELVTVGSDGSILIENGIYDINYVL